ncbi:MAG: MBL fold metallo-hydrolase [Bacteroidota bacterium]
MKIEQIYTGCLAQGTYYIESNGEAAIIDPLRESGPYIKKAEKEGSKIKYVFETHFHADFVSGHLDLADKTGATIVFGPKAETDYDIRQAKDEEIFDLGNVKIKVLHTPGHTPESTCYLLIDEEGKEKAIFTGDTLFIGDVGRPDLAISSNVTQEDLAGMLFDSLRNKVMPLPDEVIVYPAHGAGSACGKNMSKETSDTLGNQKETNYALDPKLSKDDFIKVVTDGLLPPPGYFAKNAMMNKTGYESLDSILEKGAIPLTPDEFEDIVNRNGALVLDTRKPADFEKAFIPNSIFIGIDGGFAPWVGALIPDINQPIVFICDEGREEEVVTRLSRVGYDNTLGFLEGGISKWQASDKEIDKVVSISAEKLLEEISSSEPVILDVRKPTEFQSGHIEIAQNVPLDFINEHIDELDENEAYHVHCAGGYRSMIAASILKSRGYYKIYNVLGGYEAIKKTDISLAEGVEQ